MKIQVEIDSNSPYSICVPSHTLSVHFQLFILFSLSMLSSTLGTRQMCYVLYSTVSSLSMLSSTLCKYATYYTKLYPVHPCSIVHSLSMLNYLLSSVCTYSVLYYASVLRTTPSNIQSVHTQFYSIQMFYIHKQMLSCN